MKAAKWFWGCRSFSGTCKNLSFPLQLLWQDVTKGRAGCSPCSCAYRTTLQNSSKVQQPRKSQDIKEPWRIQAGWHWQHLPSNAHNTNIRTETVNQLVVIKSTLVCACISVSVIIALHLQRSRMDNQSLDGGELLVLIGSYRELSCVVNNISARSSTDCC